MHRLKSFIPRFELLATGVTSSEVREVRDKTFAVGDRVILMEGMEGIQELDGFKCTGRVIIARISLVDTLGINGGSVLLSYKDIRIYTKD